MFHPVHNSLYNFSSGPWIQPFRIHHCLFYIVSILYLYNHMKTKSRFQKMVSSLMFPFLSSSDLQIFRCVSVSLLLEVTRFKAKLWSYKVSSNKKKRNCFSVRNFQKSLKVADDVPKLVGPLTPTKQSYSQCHLQYVGPHEKHQHWA